MSFSDFRFHLWLVGAGVMGIGAMAWRLYRVLRAGVIPRLAPRKPIRRKTEPIKFWLAAAWISLAVLAVSAAILYGLSKAIG